MKLENAGFGKNIKFYAKMTRKCLVCDSDKICSNQFGILCECCGALWRFE
ncbi:MAG: hypothetical protein ACW9W3_07350 [Candidatus Nitrosopumilus sp. bin_68KS]